VKRSLGENTEIDASVEMAAERVGRVPAAMERVGGGPTPTAGELGAGAVRAGVGDLTRPERPPKRVIPGVAKTNAADVAVIDIFAQIWATDRTAEWIDSRVLPKAISVVGVP